MDDHFVQQRHTADTAGPGSPLNVIWFERMKAIFKEINAMTGCVPCSNEPFNFLDLGCCPGGFSSYILKQNRKSRGFGISLDVSKGGHEFLLEQSLRSRYQLLFTDLTYFDLGPPCSSSTSPLSSPITGFKADPRLQRLPPQIKYRHFSLVVLDGHLLRTQDDVRQWDYDRLLIAQLIIGLLGLKARGTLVVKLSRPDAVRTAKLLYMLDGLSAEKGGVVTCKPRSMHTNRGTFYAVAHNVGLGRIPLSKMVMGLQKLWHELTYGGVEGCGRFLEEEDLDFIVTTEKLIADSEDGGYMERLVELASEVWDIQSEALRVLLRRKGVRV